MHRPWRCYYCQARLAQDHLDHLGRNYSGMSHWHWGCSSGPSVPWRGQHRFLWDQRRAGHPWHCCEFSWWEHIDSYQVTSLSLSASVHVRHVGKDPPSTEVGHQLTEEAYFGLTASSARCERYKNYGLNWFPPVGSPTAALWVHLLDSAMPLSKYYNFSH